MTADTETRDERQRSRRAARRAANRAEVLDAAELVFSRDGLHNASMRSIATEAGFSTAALYLFFENRQHILAETLTRRGDELNGLFDSIVEGTPVPLEALHEIIDATLGFFAERENFRRVLSELRGGMTIIGSTLADYASDVGQRLSHAQELLSSLVASGQENGSIRPGDPLVLAQLYMVLVNEFVYLRAETTTNFSTEAFHQIVDDAITPTRATKR